MNESNTPSLPEVKPETVPFGLYAWVIEAQPNQFGVPMVPLQMQPGAPPVPMTLVFLSYDEAMKAKPIAEDLASRSGKVARLVGIEGPTVHEIVQPKRIIAAAPGQMNLIKN